MLVFGPTVNSYKRYWDAGQFAPSRINWGMDNKTCTVRLSAVGRLEFKLPDAMVNPYLSHAILIRAVADGLAANTDPGEPQAGSSYAGGSKFARLPLTLGEALTAFQEDVLVRSGEAVSSPEGLRGKRVAAISASTNLALAETFDEAVTVPFDGASDDVFGDMLAALRAGDVDAVVDDDVVFVPLADSAEFDLAFTVKTGNR